MPHYVVCKDLYIHESDWPVSAKIIEASDDMAAIKQVWDIDDEFIQEWEEHSGRVLDTDQKLRNMIAASNGDGEPYRMLYALEDGPVLRQVFPLDSDVPEL